MAREAAPAFQFYPKDFLSDEKQAAMSVAEAGVYIRLLSICWLERTIPDDVTKISRMVGTNLMVMRRLWPAVKACFVEAEPGRLQQPRLERERQKQEAFRQLQREKGQASAAARWPPEAPNGHRGSTAVQPRWLSGYHPVVTERQPKGKSSSSSSSSSPSSDVRTSKEQAGVHATEGTETQQTCVSLPAVLRFACRGQPCIWELTQTHVDQWRSAYPNLDIVEECRHAEAWLEAAPDRRKTAKGMARFLVNWFNRSTDRGRGPSGPSSAPLTVGAINAAYVARRRKESR